MNTCCSVVGECSLKISYITGFLNESLYHSCIHKNKGINNAQYVLEFLAAVDILEKCKHNSYENSQ